MRTGTANPPLHCGAAPAWLFARMARLAREMTILMVDEDGTQGSMQRLSDSHWFQAFGCVLGFDWHSSGLITTTCGALKGGLRDVADELGLHGTGGIGNTSRHTSQEIERRASSLHVPPTNLVCAGRMSARVDNTAVQDGYPFYHHVMIFDWGGYRSVIQQGVRDSNPLRDGVARAKLGDRDRKQALRPPALFQEGPQTNGA